MLRIDKKTVCFTYNYHAYDIEDNLFYKYIAGHKFKAE